ncbi:FK506-binding protein-like protein [Heterostelium album PN500]|uniref:peptidylprolyl isomerase n=1 Tax=Heterostelium pallidum (strain ATCC 26659 / Pp 5 / PN500) TaxID=670386 RepID=D3B696_HETP5|nr:FK506-binding protein-like protein [Heterostelium album PN500]EFA82866.1 FK506-binding protein-like protein [Heterostelium album PN500]|eukprot:XP_020434983.1 FK506-binding protein-like protein [Heterostelium album PN500]
MGIRVRVIRNGDGRKPKTGDVVTIHYTGRLTNGTIFDSSVMKGTPFTFRIGLGQVIRGFDQGLSQMSTGEIAQLTISSDLAYGVKGTQGIPPNSTLIFEIEVLSIQQNPDY